MMSKANSASSTNSATSSETSETHSVEENNIEKATLNQSANAKSRGIKTWQRVKEMANDKETESKKPPWRAVSLSTLPKPDKNALLRAKLLDASRRLRAGKVAVGVQVDLTPTKLMKEVNLGAQLDLIIHKDVGMLTDGSYAKKKNGPNDYILTYSISQMTDTTPCCDVSTQTLLPRAYHNETMKLCLLKNSSINQFIATELYEKHQRDLDSAFTPKPPNLLCPTLPSWHFEYDAINIDADKQFIPYTIEARKPWSSFASFPFKIASGGSGSMLGNQIFDWYELLQLIDELILGSNNLMDTVDQFMEERNNQHKNVLSSFNRVPKIQLENYVPLSDHWLPIIEQQEKELDIMLKTVGKSKK